MQAWQQALGVEQLPCGRAEHVDVQAKRRIAYHRSLLHLLALAPLVLSPAMAGAGGALGTRKRDDCP